MINNKKLIHWVKKNWDVRVDNIKYYTKAVTVREYESLEYLGDSLLDFVISDYLIQNFPQKQPGWLTKKRMSLVNEQALVKIGKKTGVHKVVNIPETATKEQITNRVIADIVEALLGAIYLDKGIKKCFEVINTVFNLQNITEDLNSDILNPIGTLQEILEQKNFPKPKYTLIKKSGSQHHPSFLIEASCKYQNTLIKAKAISGTKKNAVKKAAKKLLDKISKIQ